MSHIAATNQRSWFFSKSSFVILSLATPAFITAIVLGDDIAKAMKEIGKEKPVSATAAATSEAVSARPKDYTELSLGGERLKKYRLELRGTNRHSGLLILDERANHLRFETSPPPGPGLYVIAYPSGTRTFMPPGNHSGSDPFGLWGKLTKGGRNQPFSIEAKGDCTVTLIVSVQ